MSGRRARGGCCAGFTPSHGRTSAFTTGWARSIEALATLAQAPPPAFRLPPIARAHTRHYMPSRLHSPTALGKTDRVLDAFAALDPDAELEVWWQAYRRDREDGVGRGGAARSDTSAAPSRSVRCGCSKETRSAGSTPFPPQQSEGLADEQELVPLLCAEGNDPLDALATSIGQLRRERMLQPPRTRFVDYAVREADPPVRTPTPVESPTLACFRVIGGSRPGLHDAVTVCAVLRGAAQSKHGKDRTGKKSPVFSGHAQDGPRRDQHRHAHYLALPDDDGRRIDRLVVWAPEGFGEEEVASLAALRELYLRGHAEPLRLALTTLGDAERIVLAQVLGPSNRWRSLTPFALPRHTKRRGGRIVDGPEDQIRRELAFRDTDMAGLLTRVVPIRSGEWARFRRTRPGVSRLEAQRVARRGTALQRAGAGPDRARRVEPLWSGPVRSRDTATVSPGKRFLGSVEVDARDHPRPDPRADPQRARVLPAAGVPGVGGPPVRGQRGHGRGDVRAPGRGSRARGAAGALRAGGGAAAVEQLGDGLLRAPGPDREGRSAGGARRARWCRSSTSAAARARPEDAPVGAGAGAAVRAGAAAAGCGLPGTPRRGVLRGDADAPPDRDHPGAHRPDGGGDRAAARGCGRRRAAAAADRQPEVPALLAGRNLPAGRGERAARACAAAPAAAGGGRPAGDAPCTRPTRGAGCPSGAGGWCCSRMGQGDGLPPSDRRVAHRRIRQRDCRQRAAARLLRERRAGAVVHRRRLVQRFRDGDAREERGGRMRQHRAARARQPRDRGGVRCAARSATRGRFCAGTAARTPPRRRPARRARQGGRGGAQPRVAAGDRGDRGAPVLRLLRGAAARSRGGRGVRLRASAIVARPRILSTPCSHSSTPS